MRFPPDVFKALGRAATIHGRTANAQTVQYGRDGLQREGLLVPVTTNKIGIAFARFVDKHGHKPERMRATEADVLASYPGDVPGTVGAWKGRGVPIVIDPSAVDPVAEGGE